MIRLIISSLHVLTFASSLKKNKKPFFLSSHFYKIFSSVIFFTPHSTLPKSNLKPKILKRPYSMTASGQNILAESCNGMGLMCEELQTFWQLVVKRKVISYCRILQNVILYKQYKIPGKNWCATPSSLFTWSVPNRCPLFTSLRCICIPVGIHKYRLKILSCSLSPE